jgi:hypothetical protein
MPDSAERSNDRTVMLRLVFAAIALIGLGLCVMMLV